MGIPCLAKRLSIGSGRILARLNVEAVNGKNGEIACRSDRQNAENTRILVLQLGKIPPVVFFIVRFKCRWIRKCGAFGGWIRSMDHFIEVVYQASRALPAGWHLRIREHPSSRQSFGKKLRALQDERFVLWNQGTSKSQIENAEAVVTLNSSVGLHGFLFDKPVIVLGQAYWNFGALTTRVKCLEGLYETFSCPTNLDYDDAARSDFMNYLVSEYLIRIPDGNMRKPFDLPPSELAKVAKHLQRADA